MVRDPQLSLSAPLCTSVVDSDGQCVLLAGHLPLWIVQGELHIQPSALIKAMAQSLVAIGPGISASRLGIRTTDLHTTGQDMLTL